MISVTRYLADDGTLFESARKAVEHELLCAELKELQTLLRPLPSDEGCRFSNGHGFVRQDPAAVLAYQAALVRVARRFIGSDETHGHHLRAVEAADRPAGRAFASRLVHEACPGAVYQAWYRLECMSDDFREWGQPYFGANPKLGEQLDRTPKSSTVGP